MGRLTKKNWNEVAYSTWETCGLDSYCKRSCDGCHIPKVFDKLAHYEDLEEQGRLIELPCGVGDTVYKITTQRDAYDDQVYPIIIQAPFRMNMLSLINKNVFLTKEEAEAKLKELEGVKE